MFSIEELYQNYKTDVYYYLLSLTRDHTLAEDLLSETFMKAFLALPSFRGDSSIKTWLIGIARNVWLQHLRKAKHWVEYDDLLCVYLAESESIEEHFLTKEKLERIRTLLATKDERTRSIVNMRVEGWSYPEIAQRWDITENSARVIDFRTRKWIKETLKKEDYL